MIAGNAKIVGFEKDLNMHGYDYNLVLTIFYIAYILFEIPCNLACKWIGPGWFLPIATIGFGVMTICMAFIQGMASAYAVRWFLGIFEAGMLPGIAYYLSRFYRRSELTFRLSLYVAMTPLAGAFGGLLASAILKLKHFGSLHTWRMLFAIEGIITAGLGLVALLTLTDRPSTARWLSAEEKDLAIARIKSERIASTEVLDRFDRKKIYRGLFSPVTIISGIVFLLAGVSSQGLAVFLPTMVKTMYPMASPISLQLHTVPPYVVGAFLSTLIAYTSYRLDRRQIFLAASAPPTIVGYAMLVGTNVHEGSVRYGATFLIMSGIFVYGSMTNAQASANVVSDTSRAAAIGTNTMLGNIGGLISMWLYVPSGAPAYTIGNSVNAAAASSILILSVLLLLWMIADNRKRDQIDVHAQLIGKSQQDIQDLEWKHPAFRWKP